MLEVLFVDEELVLTRLVAVALVEVISVIFALEMVVVASVTVPVAVRFPVLRLDVEALARFVCPVTVSVPFETSDDVAVILPPVTDPPVSVENTAVAALRILVKKLVEVAEVKVADDAVRFVIVLDALVVVAKVVTPVKFLLPAKVCVVVDIRPRDVVPASGMLKVCVLPTDEIFTSLPVFPIAKNCERPERPFKLVMPDPAIPSACHVEPLLTKS